jgi:hypothetical protein
MSAYQIQLYQLHISLNEKRTDLRAYVFLTGYGRTEPQSRSIYENQERSRCPTALWCLGYCRLCSSLCIEAANHDTSLTPHDAIHQPEGIAGVSNVNDSTLVSKTCSNCHKNNLRFRVSDISQWHDYSDYAKVFPGWKNPRTNEESPLREYIFATYNEEIAKKYEKKPWANVPAK